LLIKIKLIEEQIKQQQDTLTTLNFKKMEEDKQKQKLIESIIKEVEKQTVALISNILKKNSKIILFNLLSKIKMRMNKY